MFTRFSDVDERPLLRIGNTFLEAKPLSMADKDFFKIFSFSLAQGEPNTVLARPFTIAIANSVAQKYFPDGNALGQILRYDNTYDFEITAVFEDVPANSHLQFTYLTTFESMAKIVQRPLCLPGRSTLHISKRDDAKEDLDAPFKGLDRVLRQMPEVAKQIEVTDDAAQVILNHAKQKEVIILGTTSQPMTSSASLGPVADRILHEAKCAVIAVKSGRPFPYEVYDEIAGVDAITILVDKWFGEKTFHADEFSRLREEVELKKSQGLPSAWRCPR